MIVTLARRAGVVVGLIVYGLVGIGTCLVTTAAFFAVGLGVYWKRLAEQARRTW